MMRIKVEHELELYVVAETEAAYLLAESEADEGEWFPKSQLDWDVVGDDDHDPKPKEVATFYMPEWLLKMKGWM